MKFRPLHDRVVVKRVDSETKTPAGIIIPDTAAEKPQQGEVVAVGPGARDEAGKLVPIDLKKGDKVLFGKWSGTEVKIDGRGAPHHEGKRHHGRARRSRPAPSSYRHPDNVDRVPIDTVTGECPYGCQGRSFCRSMRAKECCAASTSSPTPSR